MSNRKPEHDYYEILQVHPKASLAVIKKAYRTLLLELGNHPDQGGSATQSALITEAYGVLSHAEKRAAYDRIYFEALTGPLKRHAERASAQSEPKPGPAEAKAEPKEAAPPPVSVVVLCPKCQTKNRVKSQELLNIAKCSRCGQSLSKLPNPLAELKETLIGALAPLAKRLAGMPKAFAIGVPVAILVASAAVVAYTLTDGGLSSVDPVEKTDALKQAGKLDQAATLLQKALSREPGNARLHEKLGDVYVKQLLYDQALGEYQLAIKLNPQNSYLYTLQGNAFMQLSQLPEAELSFKQALRLDPSQSPALVALGNLYAKQQRFHDAAGLYQQALRQGASADVFYNLGMVYQWDGQASQAAGAFRQALVMDPNHRSSMVSLGALYYEQGKYDMAAAQLIKASYLQHTDLNLHLRLADIYERQGRTQEAIKEWQVCMDQGKHNPTVVERARRALQRLGVTTG